MEKMKKYLIIQYGLDPANGRRSGELETIPAYWVMEFPASKEEPVKFQYPDPHQITPETTISLKIKCAKVHPSKSIACEALIVGLSNSYERAQEKKKSLERAGIQPVPTSEEEMSKRRPIANKRYAQSDNTPEEITSKKTKSKKSNEDPVEQTDTCIERELPEAAVPDAEEPEDLLGLGSILNEIGVLTEDDSMVSSLGVQNAVNEDLVVGASESAVSNIRVDKIENALSEILSSVHISHKEQIEKMERIEKRVAILHQAISKQSISKTSEDDVFSEDCGLPLTCEDGKIDSFLKFNQQLKENKEQQLGVYNILVDSTSGGNVKDVVNSAMACVFDDELKKLLVFSKAKKCPTNPTLVKHPIEKLMICKIIIHAVKQVCKKSRVSYNGNKEITDYMSRNLTASGKPDRKNSKQTEQKKPKRSSKNKKGKNPQAGTSIPAMPKNILEEFTDSGEDETSDSASSDGGSTSEDGTFDPKK